MEILNRSAVIVKPRPPYLEWARRDDDEGLAESVFEAMLEGWVTDESHWPNTRIFEMFQQWFEVQMISLVQDLHRGETLHYIE